MPRSRPRLGPIQGAGYDTPLAQREGRIACAQAPRSAPVGRIVGNGENGGGGGGTRFQKLLHTPNVLQDIIAPNILSTLRLQRKGLAIDLVLDALTQILRFQRHRLIAIPDQDVDGRVARARERVFEAYLQVRVNLPKVPRQFML